MKIYGIFSLFFRGFSSRSIFCVGILWGKWLILSFIGSIYRRFFRGFGRSSDFFWWDGEGPLNSRKSGGKFCQNSWKTRDSSTSTIVQKSPQNMQIIQKKAFQHSYFLTSCPTTFFISFHLFYQKKYKKKFLHIW